MIASFLEESPGSFVCFKQSYDVAVQLDIPATGFAEVTGPLVCRQSQSLNAEQIEALYVELKADERARTLLETYKEEAIRSLRDVENPNLKGLLRRVIGKIFNDTEIKGWCKEFEQKNLANRTDSPAVVAVSVSA